MYGPLFQWPGVLYLIAGEVIETISGQSWEDFVDARLLKKAGMTGSNVRHSAALAGGNVATPHAAIDGTVKPIKPFDSDNTNPAGGINSSADDMAIAYRIADHYLGAPATDWDDACQKLSARQAASVADAGRSAVARRNASSRPSLPLAKYAGTYTDAWYGDIAIEAGAPWAGLVMRFTRTPSLVGDLEHWQYGTFIVRWRDRELRADAYVSFALET